MEFVYVVKRRDLFDRAIPHGFVPRPRRDPRAAGPAAEDAIARWTAAIRSRGFFVERRFAEGDSSFKQIIPYTVVTHGDEILLLRRLARGGEARLHGKLSIGVGGHINPVDTSAAVGSAATSAATPAGAPTGAPAATPAATPELDVLDAGCRRELEEEIDIRCPYALQTVGAINDDSSDVGSVHFGLVNVARCETADVVIRETDVLEGSFVSVVALREMARAERDRFETWSALILDRIGELVS